MLGRRPSADEGVDLRPALLVDPVPGCLDEGDLSATRTFATRTFCAVAICRSNVGLLARTWLGVILSPKAHSGSSSRSRQLRRGFTDRLGRAGASSSSSQSPMLISERELRLCSSSLLLLLLLLMLLMLLSLATMTTARTPDNRCRLSTALPNSFCVSLGARGMRRRVESTLAGVGRLQTAGGR